MARTITNIKGIRKYSREILNELKKYNVDDLISKKGSIRFAGNDGPVEISIEEFQKKSIKKICKKLEAEAKCSLGERLSKTELAQLAALVGSGTKETSLQK